MTSYDVFSAENAADYIRQRVQKQMYSGGKVNGLTEFELATGIMLVAVWESIKEIKDEMSKDKKSRQTDDIFDTIMASFFDNPRRVATVIATALSYIGIQVAARLSGLNIENDEIIILAIVFIIIITFFVRRK